MMHPGIRLTRLGGQYERAIQARDFDAAIRIEREIEIVAAQDENVATTIAVVRGRNFIRKLRGQESLGMW